MPDYHIVKTGGTYPWKLKLNGGIVSRHETQQTAINAARRTANVGDNVYVHGEDDLIRDEFTVIG